MHCPTVVVAVTTDSMGVTQPCSTPEADPSLITKPLAVASY